MTLMDATSHFMGLVKTFLSARNKVDAIKEELAQANDELEIVKVALVNSKDFTEKSITVDGNVITKRETKTTRLKEGVTIPDSYVVEVFDYNAMIKGEPKQRERLVKQYMIDYPEYKVKKIDEERAKLEQPELFEEVTTITLVLSKPKETLATAVPTDPPTVSVGTGPYDKNLPF